MQQQQQQQPQPQPQPQYAQPTGIPQQGHYSQADAYGQQSSPGSVGSPGQPPLPPPPIPHPNLVPQVEPYPSAQQPSAGGGPAETFGAGVGNAVGAAAADPAGAAASGASAVAPNSFATAGAVTSFVPVIGLVLSLAGLVRSRGRGAGKAAARVGVVLSLVFTAAWGAAGYYVYKSTSAKATDAGCVSADADFLGYSAQLQRDAAAMADAAGSSGGARSAAFTAAVRGYQADIAKLVADFDADSAKAGGPEMKSAIAAVGADLTGLDADFGNLATGNYAGATDVVGLNGKLMSDFQHMESVCTKA